MSKNVVYTAIFGKYDTLHEPEYIPSGCDFVCFTDQDFDSDVWEVRKITPPEMGDMVRSARRVKILAHEFLSNYDVSIWVDGNMVVRGNVNDLLECYLSDYLLAAYSHETTDPKKGRKGIYEEAEELIRVTEAGKYKGDPGVIRQQVERYQREGYPKKNGLIVTSILLRHHNSPEVERVMEKWWKEVKEESRRDQLSFNYVAWKQDFSFNVINKDGWDNQYFYRIPHQHSLWSKVRQRVQHIKARTKKIFYERS